MDGLGGLRIGHAHPVELRIEDLEVTERDVGGYDIIMPIRQFLSVYGLEAVYHDLCIVSQCRQHKPCNQILLKGCLSGALHGCREETAYTCRGFEKGCHLQALCRKGLVNLI